MKTKSLVLGSLLGILLVLLTSTTAWAAQRTLTADGNGGYYINMPATGVDTLVIPDGVTTFNVYDDGGANRDFSSRCNGYLVMRAPEGYLLRVSGYVFGKNRNGYAVGALRIWGSVPVDENGNLVTDEYTSMYWDLGDVTIPKRLSTDQEMMLRFWHYNTSREVSNGMKLTVEVVDKDGPFAVEEVSVAGGNLIDPPATAAIGDVVSVTASSAAEGYIFDHIDILLNLLL